ncbi:hypothetical protein CARUB_v10015955mg [Capsella rubella]|uniref:Uncharacterized protein n=1 Tax=Capsella rubella TaxID=81985 RepID=R0GAB8_9BRAS|nr:uncharacterized protein LOC17891255 [Capsella rubella]EOA32657.1 hypothetical protein CARUB_v10015955mg [Capsella rubella]
MRDLNNNVVKTIARWCLVLQAIMISSNAVALEEPGYVYMNVTIRNAMTGLIRPEIVYRCQSKRKDYGWHRASKPGAQFSFPIILIDGESKIPAIHICEIRSALGKATLVIENTYLDAKMCPHSSCAHEATPKGIVFRGLELDFKELFPKPKPVEYLELPWTSWPNRT